MGVSQYKCKNKCEFPIPTDIIKKAGFNVCPICGEFYPKTLTYIENYFRIIQLSKELNEAKRLFLKSEFDASVREAIIKLETIIKDKAGLKDMMGASLMAEAFNFKTDPKTKEIIEEPKIKINELSDISKRNEQEGFKLLTMGFMQGIRNIYMHTQGAGRLYYALQIITMVDLFLKQIDGESIATCSE
jgi:uncharacterized protein (TIGR02391 family)